MSKSPWRLNIKLLPLDGLFLAVFIFGYLCLSSAAAASEEARLTCSTQSNLHLENCRIAETFLRQLSKRPLEDIQSLTLNYHFLMEIDWKVRLKMSLLVELKKFRDDYHASFQLTEPVGDNLWGKFVMLIYGRHTEDYRKMIRGIKTRMLENFHLQNGNFVTDGMIEIYPGTKKKDRQRGFKILFNYKENRINFWKNRQKKDFTLSAGYKNQMGPLTAFFNYCLLGLDGKHIDIINLEQTKYPRASDGATVEKRVTLDPFPSQTLTLKRNGTNNHTEYTDIADLGCEDFFDVVYGPHVYFNYVHLHEAGFKAPYTTFFEGIIDKKKKKARTRKIQALQQSNLDDETYARRLAKIKAMEIRAAKNIVGKLIGATVEYNPSTGK